MKGKSRSPFGAATYAVSEAFARRQLMAVAGDALRKMWSASDADAHRPKYSELINLYRILRARRPKVVWEFGSGCSTAIIAQALTDNGGATFYSLEADARWTEHTRRFIPAWVQLRHAPVSPAEFAGTPGWRHANLPTEMPDLIYLDGPSLTPERRAAVDVLELESKLPEQMLLIVDNRSAQADLLRKHLRRKYEYSEQRGLLGRAYCQRLFDFR
jgi:predicted O-methyltransferase YrrM